MQSESRFGREERRRRCPHLMNKLLFKVAHSLLRPLTSVVLLSPKEPAYMWNYPEIEYVSQTHKTGQFSGYNPL